ncbi:MAG: hypothetical protein ORN27_03725 [Rhodoluna sp.]|nr:hypothetical protein [Rhodoluna sp.]
MAGWVWWLIWGGLGLLALGVWGYILYSMSRPAAKIVASIEKLMPVLEKFNQAASAEIAIEHPKSNLDDSPELLQAERDALIDRRRKRKEVRARSLVTRVKNIKLEGRFKDVR